MSGIKCDEACIPPNAGVTFPTMPSYAAREYCTVLLTETSTDCIIVHMKVGQR